jgi:cobalt/nickel transport system permease protein
MLRARAARSGGRPGVRSGGSLGWRASVAGNLVGSLFLRSYERSERIYAAMQARGFEGDVRHLAGTPVTTAGAMGLAVLLVGLAAFVASAHTWLPRA